MMPMLIVAVLLQCFDQYSTLVLIQHGGIEGNPLIAAFFGMGVDWAVIMFKTFGVGLVCFIAWACDEQRGAKILGAINAYYLVLLGVFNFRYLVRML